MSNGDRMKWDYYFNMELREFFNTLAYYKDKARDMEEKQMQWQRTKERY